MWSFLPSGNCFTNPNRVKIGVFHLSKEDKCFLYYCFNNLKWVGSSDPHTIFLHGKYKRHKLACSSTFLVYFMLLKILEAITLWLP